MDEQPKVSLETQTPTRKLRRRHFYLFFVSIVLLLFGGYVSWYLQKTKDLNDAIYLSSIPDARRPVLLPRIKSSLTADWRTYNSEIGGFSFRYPIDGWSLESPMPYPSLNWITGSQLKGNERGLFLKEDPGQGRSDSSAQFWININIADSASSANSYNGYITPKWGGTLGLLPNGIKVWQTSKSTYHNPNSLKCGFTNVGIVWLGTQTGTKSYTALPNGKYLNYIARYCQGGIAGFGNKLHLSYGLQARSEEMKVAQEVLASITYH